MTDPIYIISKCLYPETCQSEHCKLLPYGIHDAVKIENPGD